MSVVEDAMRGDPNSIVCQLAWKPSGEIVESIGSVVPLKLGLGHGERNVAASSLPANCTVNDEVPRSETVDLKGTRTLSATGGASGAFASTSAAPRQACSVRNASRHCSHCRSAPATEMLSVERMPVRLDTAPNATAASFHRKRPSLSA